MADLQTIQTLHATIGDLADWLASHHIPRSQYDAPYRYRREFSPDYASGNDVAGLSRISYAARQRGIEVPAVLEPLSASAIEGEQVTPADVAYVDQNAREIAQALDELAPIFRSWEVAKDASWLRRGILTAAAIGGLSLATGIAAGWAIRKKGRRAA